MSNVNQLLSKAMSTTSEEEAMSCLRMARKKSKTFEGSTTSNDYNGRDAKYWYEKAELYYNKAKEKHEGLTLGQQQHLWKMYEAEKESVLSLRREKRSLEDKIKTLEAKPTGWWKLPLIALQAAMIIVLIQMIG